MVWVLCAGLNYVPRLNTLLGDDLLVWVVVLLLMGFVGLVVGVLARGFDASIVFFVEDALCFVVWGLLLYILRWAYLYILCNNVIN